MHKFIFISFFRKLLLTTFFMIICGSVLNLYSAIFFFELSPRPWSLQNLTVGPGWGTLVVVFFRRY